MFVNMNGNLLVLQDTIAIISIILFTESLRCHESHTLTYIPMK